MLLIVENLKKSFDDNLIFEDLSFAIEGGEIATFQGKSGEGKTTLMRCINALERVDSGSIKVDGLTLCRTENGIVTYCNKKDLKKYRMNVGMVFQNFNLFPHLTVYENLSEAPRFHKKLLDSQIKEKAANLIKELELDGKEDSYPFQLSGGQRQRVAIARAVMLSPKILCFDEPTSALDEENRSTIEGIIKKLANKKMGIMIITHDSIFAQNVSDTIYHLKNKEIAKIQI